MKFFLATKNNHKIIEFSRMLNSCGIELISEKDLDTPLEEVDENGADFAENAFIKANAAMQVVGIPSIADDSGLCVDYLDGAPGIYSARFAGEPVDNDKNNEKLLSLLEGVPEEKRTAKFVSSIVCVFPDGRTVTAEGECAGYIATEKSGSNGFGYDPLFISEIGCFGELTDAEKDSVSHRGNALKEFTKKITEVMKEDKIC
jgi:XTP/dITP diphosphohydrolase